MVKKRKALSGSDDERLADAVRTSARQIWQAGLGAFAKARQEGTQRQKRTKGKMAGGIVRQAAESWGKLEQVFEERVARSLASLDVPTRGDIEALAQRIEELNKTVAALEATRAAPPVPSATKTAAKKAAAGKTRARKSAAQAPTPAAAPRR